MLLNLLFVSFVSIFTPCVGALAEPPRKIWPAKLLPSEKSLDFSPTRFILHNLVHPRQSDE